MLPGHGARHVLPGNAENLPWLGRCSSQSRSPSLGRTSFLWFKFLKLPPDLTQGCLSNIT